jgi:hypothetical protein
MADEMRGADTKDDSEVGGTRARKRQWGSFDHYLISSSLTA